MSLSEELKKKIARIKLKETGTFVSIYAGDLIYDILRVDPRVIDGVDFLRKDDLSNVLKFGKQEIVDRAEKSKESLAGLHDSYTGYTFERIVALDFQQRGAEVQFPSSAQQSGYDLVINGENFQVKTQGDGIDIIERHFEKYPYTKVISNSEAYEKFLEKYPDKNHLIINSGFNHVQTEDLVKQSTDAAVEVFEDNNLFGSAIPEILGIVSIISIGKNFMSWSKGNTDIETALKNVAIDSVGKFAGAGVGAKLGSFILPPFGTIVGGTLGFMFGGNLANEYKIENYCKTEMENLKKAIDEYLKKSEEILDKNSKIFEDKVKILNEKFKNKKGERAREFEIFINKKIINERRKKDDILRIIKKYFKKARRGIEKFEQLSVKFEGETSSTKYNHYALEALKLSNRGGVSPEFIPEEAKNLFDKVKHFMEAAKKHGV